MNDKLKDYINVIGSLVETWDMVYRVFKSHGYSDRDALTHTELFMRTFLTSVVGSDKEEGK